MVVVGNTRPSSVPVLLGPIHFGIPLEKERKRGFKTVDLALWRGREGCGGSGTLLGGIVILPMLWTMLMINTYSWILDRSGNITTSSSRIPHHHLLTIPNQVH